MKISRIAAAAVAGVALAATPLVTATSASAAEDTRPCVSAKELRDVKVGQTSFRGVVREFDTRGVHNFTHRYTDVNGREVVVPQWHYDHCDGRTVTVQYERNGIGGWRVAFKEAFTPWN
jgi:hypothetical protein